MATRYTIAYYFVINFLINFPFIVCNLYFAYNGINNCSKMGILQENLGISLASWLKIFGFNQLLYILSILIAALLRLCTGETKDCLLVFSVCIIIFNSIIQIGWLIIGGILFWGQQYTECSSSLRIFMYCLLIVSYFAIAFNLVLTRKYCLESQFK